MEVRTYYRLIFKRLWLILLTCLVGSGIAFYTSVNQTPMYATTTTLMINPAMPNPLLPYQISASIDTLTASYNQFIRTRSFATMVAQAMGPEVSPDFVLGSISGQGVPGTQFYRISATSSSPEMAQKLANTTARVFIQQNVAQQKSQQEQLSSQQALDARSILDRQRVLLQQTLEDELKYYQSQTNSLRGRITELEKQPQGDAQSKDLTSLRLQLTDMQNLSMKALTTLSDLQTKPVNAIAPSYTAIVIDEAILPTRPIGSSADRNVLLALVFSLVLGLGGVFLFEYLDYTFKTPEELEQGYGLSTLGMLGRVDSEFGSKEAREKIVLSQPKSSIAEAFRTLRTNVQFASLDKPVRSLLVTSASPAEGKTFSATNLAIAMAQAGKQVILVDCDLRRPTLHRVFELSNASGVTSAVLENPGNVGKHLQATEVEGLKVLTCGPLPPNPSEILGSQKVDEIIRDLHALADIVIIDTPPAAMVTDAAILATKVDAVIHVVRAGMTRRDLVLKGRDALTKVGGRVLGPVLNMVQASDAGYYYHYYYRRYYGERSRN